MYSHFVEQILQKIQKTGMPYKRGASYISGDSQGPDICLRFYSIVFKIMNLDKGI